MSPCRQCFHHLPIPFWASANTLSQSRCSQVGSLRDHTLRDLQSRVWPSHTTSPAFCWALLGPGENKQLKLSYGDAFPHCPVPSLTLLRPAQETRKTDSSGTIVSPLQFLPHPRLENFAQVFVFIIMIRIIETFILKRKLCISTLNRKQVSSYSLARQLGWVWVNPFPSLDNRHLFKMAGGLASLKSSQLKLESPFSALVDPEPGESEAEELWTAWLLHTTMNSEQGSNFSHPAPLHGPPPSSGSSVSFLHAQFPQHRLQTSKLCNSSW